MMKRSLVIVTLFLISSAAIAAGFFLGGFYNVAATEPHTKPVESLLTFVLDRSVSRHSKGIEPPDLTNPDLVTKGAPQYQAMCAVCHGAPGQTATEISKGLNPPAPELQKGEVQRIYSDSELFWIAKHGIRMTGMPAFGPTHNDPALWAIIAFIKRLPEVPAAEYERLTKASAQDATEPEHR